MFAVFRSLLKRFSRPAREKHRLHVTAQGLSAYAGSWELWAFRWEEVTRIMTYKADLLTVDMICLDFLVEPRRLACHTDDEMPGFGNLCGCLRLHFPGIAERWWFDVAFPAFATNGKVLYEAAAAST